MIHTLGQLTYLGCLAGAFALLSGCADTHQLARATGKALTVNQQASAYVGLPKDGRFGNTLYSGSGALTAQAVAVAFSPYFGKVTVGIKHEDFSIAQQTAKAGGYSYLLYPDILHWEDRATEWSGRPDQASVKVSVIDANTGKILDSAVVSGKSGLATFGGDRPEHLLPKPLADYAATLFRTR
ncbi:MAG: DUF4823 domain-containing protein [Gammaproteobacteria bacterium]